MEEKELRRYSRVVVDGDEQAPSRAILRAVGFSEDDFKRPQIGIASTWSMVTPCNMHIGDLAGVLVGLWLFPPLARNSEYADAGRDRTQAVILLR